MIWRKVKVNTSSIAVKRTQVTFCTCEGLAFSIIYALALA